MLSMILNHDINQVKEIWLKCFDVSEDYFDSFLIRFYRPDYMISYKVNNKIVSVSYIIPCTSAMGNTAYLFGLATLPEYRGKGYASALVSETLEACKVLGFDVAVLIPEKKNSTSYYSKFGYIDAGIHLSFTTDFILGIGNPNEDIAMIAFLKNQNKDHYPKELLCTPCAEI